MSILPGTMAVWECVHNHPTPPVNHASGPYKEDRSSAWALHVGHHQKLLVNLEDMYPPTNREHRDVKYTIATPVSVLFGPAMLSIDGRHTPLVAFKGPQ